MSETNRGERVILRAYGDEPYVRVVWAETDETVLVCDDEQYARRLQGEEFDLLGFPLEYVYAYDKDAIDSGLLREPDWWLRLPRWSAA